MPVFLLIIVLTLFAFPYELFIFVLNILHRLTAVDKFVNSYKQICS